MGGTEVAGVEGLDVARKEGLKLVDGDVLPTAEVTELVKTEGAVRVGNGVVSETARVLSVDLGRAAGIGRVRGVENVGARAFGNVACTDAGPGRV